MNKYDKEYINHTCKTDYCSVVAVEGSANAPSLAPKLEPELALSGDFFHSPPGALCPLNPPPPK